MPPSVLNQGTFSPSLSHELSLFTSEHEIETVSAVKTEEVVNEIQQITFYTLILEIEDRNKTIKKTKPIALRLYSEDGHFFVENENLSLFGEGSTTQEAVDDFIAHLTYYYHYYQSLDRSKVLGEGIRLKDIYDSIFR